MKEIEQLVEELYSKDAKSAYNALQQLEAESDKSKDVYKFFDRFAEMIDDSNSYIRTRGLCLIAANAKNDSENKINNIIDKYLEHILDEKPITARQCIKVLPVIAQYKPDLTQNIKESLTKADISIYADSMQGLVYKDILAALKSIK